VVAAVAVLLLIRSQGMESTLGRPL
jgi:hypothetical protein